MQAPPTVIPNQKTVEARPAAALAAVYDDLPKRRWGRLVVPFLALVIAVAAWKTDPQTWRQLQSAVFGNTPASTAKEKSSESKQPAPTDAVFAGKGEIDVDGGLVKLFPLAYGEIEEVPVKENDHVKVGDVLLRVRNKAAALQSDEAKQLVKQAELELDRAKRSSEDFQKQLQLADLAVESEEKLVSIADRNNEQVQKLSSQISEESGRMSKDATVVAKQRLEAKKLERERLKLRRPQDDVKAAETALERAKIKLAQADEDADRSTLKARTAGKIIRSSVNVGETFGPATREPAFLLLPDKPWIVRCEIEQEFAGRVKVGMPVEIRDDATGETVAQGKVDRVSGVFAPRRQPVDDARLHNDFRTMECTVVLQPPTDALRIGQHVRALFKAGR